MNHRSTNRKPTTRQYTGGNERARKEEGQSEKEKERERMECSFRSIGWPCHKSPVMECVSRVKGRTSIENRWRSTPGGRCVFRVALIGLCFVGGGTGGCPGSTSSAVRVYYSNVEQISVVDMPDPGLNIRSIPSRPPSLSLSPSPLFVSPSSSRQPSIPPPSHRGLVSSSLSLSVFSRTLADPYVPPRASRATAFLLTSPTTTNVVPVIANSQLQLAIMNQRTGRAIDRHRTRT